MACMDEQTAQPLKQLNDATREEQLVQLKEAVSRMGRGTPRVELDKKRLSLSDLRQCLDNHTCDSQLQGVGLGLLYALAEEIGLPVKELKILHQFVRLDVLAQCKQRQDFQFEKMIINISNGMTVDDFKKFFDLCKDCFDHTIIFEKFPTIAQFFTMLISARKVVWQGNVAELYRFLELIGKVDCLEHIRTYRKFIGELGQAQEYVLPSEEESNPSKRATCSLKPSVKPDHQSESLVGLKLRPPTRSFDNGDMVTGKRKSMSRRVNSQSENIIRSRGQAGSEENREQQTPTLRHFSDQFGKPPELIRPSGGQPSDVFTDRPPQGTDPTNSEENPTENATDKTGLLDQTPEKFSLKMCVLKHKQQLFCLIVMGVVLVFALGAVAVVTGAVEKKRYEGVSTQAKLMYIVGGDTVVLDKYNADSVTEVSVDEKMQRGDSSHLRSVYVVPVDELNKHETQHKAQRPTISQDTAGPFTNLINGIYYGLYMLEMSSISYTFNIACSRSCSIGDFYLFNNQDKFINFTKEIPGAEKSAVYHKTLNIGSYNSYEPTHVNYQVTSSSYYSLAIKLLGGVSFNFSYEINITRLNRFDFEPVCSETEQPCTVHLPRSGMYYIVAYATPQEDFESAVTHLQVTASMSQSTQVRTSSIITFVGAGFLGLTAVVLCIAVVWIGLCIRSRKRSHRTTYSTV